MYRTIEDFITDWRAEAAFTVKVFSHIPVEIKHYKANEDIRTLERLAWHITHTLTEMPFKAGLIEEDFLENISIPDNFEEIITLYKMHSDKLIDRLSECWKDDDLLDTIEMYGQQWEKRKMLSVLIKHQIHHRGQMTTLMRLQGFEVPATYGPSREDWSKFGMEIQE